MPDPPPRETLTQALTTASTGQQLAGTFVTLGSPRGCLSTSRPVDLPNQWGCTRARTRDRRGMSRPRPHLQSDGPNRLRPSSNALSHLDCAAGSGLPPSFRPALSTHSYRSRTGSLGVPSQGRHSPFALSGDTVPDPFIGEIPIYGFNFAPIEAQRCVTEQLIPIDQNTALFSLIGPISAETEPRRSDSDLGRRVPINMEHDQGYRNTCSGGSASQNVALLATQLPSHRSFRERERPSDGVERDRREAWWAAPAATSMRLRQTDRRS